MKIVHIITGLNNGGAEGVLYRLCKFDTDCEHVVISMMGEGKYGSLLENVGITVHYLNMSRGAVSLISLLKLYKLLLLHRPDVVQTWMYHADLIGGLIAKIAGIKTIFWNVRHSTLEPEKSKRSTRWVAKICALLSGWVPKKIIYCALEARRVHEELGYKMDRAEVIANGYNLTQFAIDDAARLAIRSELGVTDSNIVIGMVGRFDPQKDHYSLIKSVALLRKKTSPLKLVLIGKDLDASNIELNGNIKKYDLDESICLLSQRTDIAAIMNGLDIHVLSSSFGEGFPNVLAEAMACGTPCVTTNLGDAATIVGDTGWVVPPNNSQALANAMFEAIVEKENQPTTWQARRIASRARITDNFSLEKMCNRYVSIWKDKNI